MKKTLLALLLITMSSTVFSGTVGVPQERIALPDVQGEHLVCIWDETLGVWAKDFESYDQQGAYNFQIPEWGKWYWIGLWDDAAGQYVFGKWVGHFVTN